ncbi:hypothetical protein CB1_002600005 [Camelus ferus]|nr:hypothetical protein CB1_002600005 [Camelus ferus]
MCRSSFASHSVHKQVSLKQQLPLELGDEATRTGKLDAQRLGVVPSTSTCSASRQKLPHGLQFLQMCLVLHSLNEIFVNAAQALVFPLKPLSSSQPLGPCLFCPNHSVKVLNSSLN